MFKNRFTLSLTRNEAVWGIRYLLFQQVFLPWLLAIALLLTGFSLDDELLNFLYYLVNFCAVLWIFRSFLKNSLIHTRRNIRPFFVCVVLGLAAVWSMTQVLSGIIYTLVPEFYNVNDAAIYADAQSHFLLTAIGTVVLVPTAEECLFRGLLFSLFRRRSRFLGYAMSALLFCAVHVAGYVGLYDVSILAVCFLQYLPAGIALAWAFESSGSIFAPIVIHTIVNFSAIVSMR